MTRMVHPSAAKIRRGAGTPDTIWSTVYPFLIEFAVLLPDWLHEFNVVWIDDDTNGALAIRVHHEYRRADMQVLPNFLTGATKERMRQNVLHELTHLYTSYQREAQHHALRQAYADNPAALAIALEHDRLTNEAATCDLAAAFERLFNAIADAER